MSIKKAREDVNPLKVVSKLIIMIVTINIINFTWPQVASAEIVSESLPNGLPVTAEFKPGDPNKPAIIVMHGFLQTYTFLATHNIIEGLSGLDYTVLGPNLSLGVPKRKRSLQCEAVHQHTLADDLQEIDYWRGWLENKGHKQLIFVGHSWGGQHILAYLSSKKSSANILGIIAISLLSGDTNKQKVAKQLEKIKRDTAHNSDQLHKFELSFCENYTGTSQSYLSYAEWDDSKLLASIKTVINADIPMFTILGSEDKRLRGRYYWLDVLRDEDVKVTVVEGANHFFSASYEFALIDELEVILDALSIKQGR